MKIKNIAFFGVMASILGLGVARADDNQIIASKAYVDAKVDANTQEQADFSTLDTTAKTYIKNKPNLAEVSEAGKAIVAVSQSNGQVAASTGTIGSAGLADSAVTTTKINNGAVTFGKLDSAAVVDYTEGLASDVASASDSAVPTEKAVRAAINNIPQITVDQTYDGTSANAQAGKAVKQAIDALDVDTATAGQAGTEAVVAVTQTDGKIAVKTGTITDAGLASNAVTEAKIKNGAVTANKIGSGAVTFAKLNSAAVVTATEGIATDVNSASDSAVPTEKAVRAAINGIEFPAVDSTYNSASSNAQAGTAVAGALETLDVAITTGETGATKGVANQADIGKAITAITQTDGFIDPVLGQVGSAGIADSAVTTDKINAKAVTTAKIADSAVTEIKIATDAVTTNKIKNSAVTTGKIADSAVTFAKLDSSAVNNGTLSSSSTTTLATEKTIYDAIKSNAVTGTYNSSTTYDSGTIGYAIQNASMGVKKADGISATQYSEGVVAANSLGKPIMKFDKNANNELVATLGEIKNVGVASDANIDYSKMNKGLPNINNAVNTDGSSSCTAASPCVLSYNGSNYSWTNMDTEGVNAQTANP